MNKRFFALTILMLLSLLGACAQPAATPTAAPTPAPQPITITLWHAWTGAEETALKEILDNFMADYPNITVNPLQVPFDQLQSKFTTEAGAGGGPDILIGPTDWVGPLAEAGLLRPLDEAVADVIGDYLPSTVEALKWQGKLYGFPESFECVAMYYNTSLVDRPPKTIADLKAVAAEKGLAFNTGFYFAFGFIPAFGGRLFDENFKCVLDQGGTVDFLAFMKEMAAAPGVQATDDYGKLETLFKEGQVGLIFNGPWAMGDYVAALGKDKVAVAPLPSGPYPAGPFLGVKHVMFNANSDDAHFRAALQFVKYLTNPENSALLMDKAGHLPANSKVQIPAGAAINGFIEQARTATPFPNVKEMGAVWTPGGDMIKKVIAGELTPEQAVQEATQLINEANKKVAPQPVTITLWHAWTGAEETALKEILDNFMADYPNITVNPLQVPFDQLQSKFTTEAGAGGGPDILIGPTDWVGPLAEAGLLRPLDEAVADVIGDYLPSTVEALKWQGKLYGFPESFECVAMYYNTSLVDRPPKTVADLKAVAAEKGLAFNTGFYFAFGFIPAFGGKLFDENFRCVLDQGGTVDFLAFMKEMAAAPGVQATDDYGKLETLFKEGQVGLIFNGPWAMGDYVAALGKDKVAVAPLPSGPYPAGPFLGVKHVMFNANSDDAHFRAALQFVKYLTNPENSALLMDKAGHLPANSKVKIPAGAAINGFIEQARTATPFPNVKEMGAVWTPGGDMIKKVIAGELTPEQAVREATQLINEANKK